MLPGNMQTLGAREALVALGYSSRSHVSLPGLDVTLYESTIEDAHDTLIEPSDQFQIGYLFDALPTERLASLPELRSAAHFAPMGDLFLIPPDTPFRTRCAPMRATGVQCLLKTARFETLWETSFAQWNRDQFEASVNIRDPQIHRYMRELVRELMSRGTARDFAIDYLVSLTLIHAGRHLAERASALGTLPGWQLRRVEEMVREQRDPTCTIADIARACGVSASHLMRAYKKTTGRTIGQLIEEVRIDEAKRMLRQTPATIGEIAALLGFSSQPHFSTAFHRAEGLTPRSYRQMAGVLTTHRAGGVH